MAPRTVPVTQVLEELVEASSMAQVLVALAEVARNRSIRYGDKMPDDEPSTCWEYERVATLLTAVADTTNDI